MMGSRIFQKKIMMINLIRIYIISFLLITIVAIASINFIYQSKLENQSVGTEQVVLDEYAENLDNEINRIFSFSENILINDEDVTKLNHEISYSERYYALVAVKKKLVNYIQSSNSVCNLFFCSSERNDNTFVTSEKSSTSADFYVKEWIKDKLIEKSSDKFAVSKFCEKFESGYYFICIVKANENYAGFWFNMEEFLLDSWRMISEDRVIFLTDLDGTIYTGKYMDSQFDMSRSNYVDLEGIEFFQIHARLHTEDIILAERMQKSLFFQAISDINNVLIIISIISIIALLILAKFFERYLYRPVRAIITSIREVAEGNFETEVKEKTSFKEIDVLKKNVNEMIHEIKNLKIKVYEEKLEKQETELQYLQEQIQPHFLTNALNSVYSMTEIGQYEGVQKMCIYLIKYFRFIYSTRDVMITVFHEVEHVSNYVNIQNIRFSDKIQFKCVVEKECESFLIPPLAITTFVENSYKYGLSCNQENIIRVEVKKVLDGIEIMIKDSGPGFSIENLEYLNNGKRIPQDNKRKGIGIYNVQKRFALLYAQKVEIVFYNDQGACVKLRIPMY